jgi:hypothetical protein
MAYKKKYTKKRRVMRRKKAYKKKRGAGAKMISTFQKTVNHKFHTIQALIQPTLPTVSTAILVLPMLNDPTISGAFY